MSRVIRQYRLRLASAAVFPKGDADPNTVDTWDRVPGGVMLGAFAARWLDRHPEEKPACNNTEFRRLFLTGQTRFLHAMPEGPDHSSARVYRQPLLPCPLSLHQEKKNPHKIHDLAEIDEPIDPESDLRRSDLGYVRFGERLQHRRPETELRMHHQRERERGRPVEDGGAIFAYQSIRAGERFIGEIHASKEDHERLESLLDDAPLRLGRSRGTEYGGNAAIEWLARPAEEELLPRAEDGPPRLVVTLLSEYAGRTEGEATAEAFLEDLYAALGSRPPLARRFIERRQLAGYVAAWHLPRPTHEVLAAGSVFVFDAPAEPKPRIVWLGERQAEGLGRVAIGWHGGVRKIDSSAFIPAKMATPSAADGPLARAMLREWVLQEMPACVAEHPLPSASVLGAYRAGGLEALGRDGKRAIARCRVRIGDVRVLLEELSRQRCDPLSYLDGRSRPEWLRGTELTEEQEREICRLLADSAIDVLRRTAARGDR